MAVYNVGTGLGNLTIDGSKTAYKAGDLIKVKAGRYTAFNVQNIDIADGYVTIQNEGGLVEVIGSLTSAYNVCLFSNISGINISGNGTSGIDKGFYFHDNKYRMISVSGINGIIKNFTMQYVKFENIADYTLYFYNFNKVYDGTDNTASNNLKLLNIECINCSLLTGAGDITKITGVLNGLEIANCYFHDSPNIGGVAYWNGVNDYDIHDNIIDNINIANDNHNGIFMLIGNGKLYNNKLTNHQGNMIRAWTVGIYNSNKSVEIYNNISYNSRNYSGFELQSPPHLDAAIKANPDKLFKANAKVYNNTVGKMSTSRGKEGLLLDLYNISGGNIEYYNNLGFDLYTATGRPIINMINNISDVKIVQSNNQYKSMWQEAVADTTSFISLFLGIGANLHATVDVKRLTNIISVYSDGTIETEIQ